MEVVVVVIVEVVDVDANVNDVDELEGDTVCLFVVFGERVGVEREVEVLLDL